MGFKDSLKTARLNAGMTQQSLGEIIGVAKSTITGYEKGNSEPDMGKLQKIIQALKVDANFLFQDEMKIAQSENNFDDHLGKLVNNYTQLNEEGKEKVLNYVEDLVEIGKYKKNSKFFTSQKVS